MPIYCGEGYGGGGGYSGGGDYSGGGGGGVCRSDIVGIIMRIIYSKMTNCLVLDCLRCS